MRDCIDCIVLKQMFVLWPFTHWQKLNVCVEEDFSWMESVLATDALEDCGGFLDHFTWSSSSEEILWKRSDCIL